MLEPEPPASKSTHLSRHEEHHAKQSEHVTHPDDLSQDDWWVAEDLNPIDH